MGAGFPALYSMSNIDNLRVYVDGGKPVSLVGQLISDLELGGARLRVTCMGSVCTLEAYRGQGLASRLVDDAFAIARAQGAVVALISGGRGLYRRIGCIDAGLYQCVTVDAKSRVPSLKVEVREWTPADVPAMCALQRQERVRFIRDEERTLAVLSSRHVFARPARSWVILVNGRVSAWVAASLPAREEDGSRLTAREIAGSRAAFLAALPGVLEQAGLTEIEIEAPASDGELCVLAEAYSLPSRPLGFHGTVKIIDVPGVLRSLEGWIAERAGEAAAARLRIEPGAQTRFCLDGESMVVASTEDLAALLFGSRERPVPEPLPGRLAEVLGRVFPVPLPGYGLSYT
jgi:hypothetical protein